MTNPVEPEQAVTQDVPPAAPTQVDLSSIATPPLFPPDPIVASIAEPVSDAPKVFDESYVQKLRAENAKHRTDVQKAIADSEEKAAQAAKAAAKAATDDIAQKFGKMFGLITEDAELTPEQLVAQAQAKIAETEADAAAKIAAAEAAASAKGAEARDTTVALTVLRRAGDDVDSDALLDSSSFKARMNALDPTAADFTSQVDAEMASFLDANPGRYRKATGLVTTVPRSGGDFEAGNAHQATGEPSVESLLKQVQDGRGPGRSSRGFRSST